MSNKKIITRVATLMKVVQEIRTKLNYIDRQLEELMKLTVDDRKEK